MEVKATINNAENDSSTSSATGNILQLLIGMDDGLCDTLKDAVTETKKQIGDVANNSEPLKRTLNDAYGNSLTSVGTDDKVKSFESYGFSNDTLNWTLWLALYNDSWVFRRAIDKPAQDMVRSGVNLSLGDDKKTDVLDELSKQRKSLIELIQWGRLFGGSVGVMMFDNLKDEDYGKPIDVNKLKKAKRMNIYVTDRWYGCAPSDKTVDDMTNLDYGKPASYRITFADSHEVNVHHDYVLRFEGRTAPRLVKNGMLQGWGYAEGTHILNELARDDQLKASITSLVNKSLIEVIKMPGMRGLFQGADEKNNLQIRKRLESINWARNYNSLTFLDKDDDYAHYDFSVSGLSDLLEKNMWLISAALEMQGVLYGDLKQGFSNDTDALERYDETINNLNENYFRPVMMKLLAVIYKWKGIDDKVSFDFGSLVKNKQTKDKMEGMKDFQGLLSTMLADGVITLKQYAISIKNYAEKGVIDFGLSDEDIDKLDDKMEEEMENIDLGSDKEENFSKVKTK